MSLSDFPYGESMNYIRASNHAIGCELEVIAQTIEFRGYDKEGGQLREIAAKLK